MEIVIGIAIGLVLGLTGAGGSTLAVPLLILLLNETPNNAMGLSLAAVGISAAVGVLLHLKKANILWSHALIFAGGGFIAAPFGRYLATFADDKWVLLAFTVIAVLVALGMWRQASKDPESAKVVRAADSDDLNSASVACGVSPTGYFQWKWRCVSTLLFAGLFAGWFAGFFGVGGGFIIVPLLIMISAVPMVKAVATSLLIIAVTAFSGLVSHFYFSEVPNYETLVFLACGSVLGILFGNRLASIITGVTLQKVFAVLLVSVTMLSLYKTWS